MTCNRIIGDRIASIRGEKGESQEALAAALGVKRQVIGYWETGARPIKAETLAQIAERYHVSADYLLGLSPDPTTDTDIKAVCDYTRLSESAIHTIREVSMQHHGLLSVDNFILECLSDIMMGLSLVAIKTRIARNTAAHESLTRLPPDGQYELLQSVQEGIEVSLFRFSKLCEKIPDALGFGVKSISDEISSSLYKLLEDLEAADHGND